MKVSRRDFVRTVALGTTGLVIGFNGRGIFAAPNSKQFSPNGWVKIDIDGTVTLTIGKSEMGQGVRTSLAMILADELKLIGHASNWCRQNRQLNPIWEPAAAIA
jgi:isoquinoline 1-oxidoreductase beta subunit